ncbi:hypothetical protein N9L44_07080, partial [Porticoccaceae bacterium]|nr:hypothetical protein [Porticoccaceae bacterium]
FITKRPTDEFEAGFTLHAGSYEKYGMEGFVSGPLSESWQLNPINPTKAGKKAFPVPVKEMVRKIDLPHGCCLIMTLMNGYVHNSPLIIGKITVIPKRVRQ